MKLYGTALSRSSRCLWALEELDLEYEHIPFPTDWHPTREGFRGTTRTPEFLRINPNGRIPALEDGGVIIWESMAINLYLADKYGKKTLWPRSIPEHGQTYQWTFWALTELEPHLVTLFIQSAFTPIEQRDARMVREANARLKPALAVLDTFLKGRNYLVGQGFTIADLNVASVASMTSLVGFDLADKPEIRDWLARCVNRPANQKVRQMK